MIRRLALAAVLLATPLRAQETPPAIDPDAVVGDSLDASDLTRDRVTVALGVASIPSYEGSDSHNWIPAALAQGTVGGYAFQTRGLRLFVDAVRNRPGPTWDVQFGPVAGLNLDRTRRSRIDNAAVEALGDRKAAIELGGFLGLGKTGVLTSPFDRLSASVAVVRDVNGAHGSTVVTPQLDYGTPLSPRAFVGLSLAANHVGRGYGRTYFAVDPAGAAASGLPTFAAGSGWKDWSLSAAGLHSLTGDLLHGLSLAAGVRYSRLLDDAARSPITRDRDQWSGTIGLAYTF